MTSLSFARGAAALAMGTALATAGLLLPVGPAVIAQQGAPAAGRSWPMYGGTPARNMVNLVDRDLPTWWACAPNQRRNVKWVAKLGSRCYGAPAVAGGKVFIGTNNNSPRNPRDTRKRRDGKTEPIDRGIVICFRESDGAFLWQAVHDKLESGLVNDWPNEGVTAAPAVDGNRVYYVSNRCELVCADVEGFHDGRNDGVQDEQYKDPTDADIVWRLDMMRELGVFPHNCAAGSPLIVGDLIFVVTANGVDEGHIHMPAPEAPSFVAVHKRTGKVAWTSNLPSAKVAAIPMDERTGAFVQRLQTTGQTVQHSQWSNPAYTEVGAPQVIFPGGDGWLYAFDPPTGRLLWKFDGNSKDARYELGGRGIRSDFIGMPAVWDGHVYIGTGQDPEHFDGVGHLWCIDLARAVALGKTNPDRDVSPVDNNFHSAAPANRAKSAFVWHYGGMEKEPEKAGRDYIFGRTMSTCAVHDGLCYACDLAGFMYCLDAQTGRLHWRHDLKSSVWGSPYWVDGRIYVATEDGEVWVFAHGTDKKLIGVVDVGNVIRTTPTAANGVLYIATESQLWALALRTP